MSVGGKRESFLHAIGRLTRVDWAFLHFKAAIGFMLMVPLSQLGSVKYATTQWFIVAWLVITILGFWISLVGLVMSAQENEMRRRGFSVEMTGLWLLLCGPLAFIAIQIGIWFTTGRDTGTAIALCYVIASAIAARMIMIKVAAKSRTVIYTFLEKKEDD